MYVWQAWVVSWTHIHEQVRWGRALAAHGAGCWRMSHTHSTREARRRRRRGWLAQCAGRPRLTREAPTAPRAPTATGCLISHYNLRAARFLPLLLPRFVLRIIECIPLAPAAMRARRRPDNSRVQLRRSAVTPPYLSLHLTPSCDGWTNYKYSCQKGELNQIRTSSDVSNTT